MLAFFDLSNSRLDYIIFESLPCNNFFSSCFANSVHKFKFEGSIFRLRLQGWQRAEPAERRANFSSRVEPNVGSAGLLMKISNEPSYGLMVLLGLTQPV